MAKTSIGAFLMVLGLVGMIWAAADYFNDRKSIEIGDVRFAVEDKQIPVQGFVGAGLFGAGVLVTIIGAGNGKK